MVFSTSDLDSKILTGTGTGTAMRADAGTQADPEARGIDRAALALEAAASTIETGGHWR